MAISNTANKHHNVLREHLLINFVGLHAILVYILRTQNGWWESRVPILQIWNSPRHGLVGDLHVFRTSYGMFDIRRMELQSKMTLHDLNKVRAIPNSALWWMTVFSGALYCLIWWLTKKNRLWWFWYNPAMSHINSSQLARWLASCRVMLSSCPGGIPGLLPVVDRQGGEHSSHTEPP